MGDRTPIEQIPGLAIGVDGPTADDARVEEVEALLARPVDLPIWLAHQHRLSLMDGDLVRTDLDLERHKALSQLSRRGIGRPLRLRWSGQSKRLVFRRARVIEARCAEPSGASAHVAMSSAKGGRQDP